jgi:hypothetical protein
MVNQELITALFLRIDEALHLVSHLLNLLDDELAKAGLELPDRTGVAGEKSEGITEEEREP